MKNFQLYKYLEIKKCILLFSILFTNNLLASQSLWEINQIEDELTNQKNVLASSTYTTKKGEKLNLNYTCEIFNTKLVGLFKLTIENGILASRLASDGVIKTPVRIRYGSNEVVSSNFVISNYQANQFNQSFDFDLNQSNIPATNADFYRILRKRFLDNFGVEFTMFSGEKVVFKNNGELANYFDTYCSKKLTTNLIKAKSANDLAEKQKSIEQQNLITNQNLKRQYFQSDEYFQLISKKLDRNPYIFKDFEQLMENNLLAEKQIDKNLKNDTLNAYNRAVLTIQYECITNAKILYPRIAQDRGIEGTSIIRIDLDEKGNFNNLDVASSSGNVALDAAAISAFSKCNIADKLILTNNYIISVIVGLSFKLPE
jgi:TonB family protein